MFLAPSQSVKKCLILHSVILGVFVMLFLASSPRLAAQTSSSGVVLGTVTDSSNAVVPGVEVDLANTATNVTTKQITNAQGQYLFPNVAPGPYKLIFKAASFRTVTLQNVTVDVNKSFIGNMQMQVGEVSQTVEVTTTAQAELQTTDAQVGEVIGGSEMNRLPTLTRNALELTQLQPATAPGAGDRGGGVAGARSDQNTITLDGVDVTDNIVGEGFGQQEPLSTENIQEFRIGVTNSNATFGRSPGAQTTLVSRSGSNGFHGDAYWYHQNDEMNANPWQNNRVGIQQPELRDNRVGVSIGGPIIKQKTFFFSNYEIHRFPRLLNFSSIVPTASLRAGTLTFTDCAKGFTGTTCNGGNPVAYQLGAVSNSTACGPLGGTPGGVPCDPRNLGISPTVSALWALMPPGNDNTLGDGLNTTGFRAVLPLPIKDDNVSFRLDHDFTDKIHFLGRYFYDRDLQPVEVLDIRNGNPRSTATEPNRNDGFVGGLDYQISSNITNSFRFSRQRVRTGLESESGAASAAVLNLTGTTTTQSGLLAAIQPATKGAGSVGGGLLDVPIDNSAQNSRSQIFQGITKEIADNLFWNKGTHAISAGTSIFFLPFILNHTDKVTSTTSPTALLDTGGPSNLVIPAVNTPPTCGGAITTNCLNASDISRWGSFYAGTLGIVNNVNVVGARDGNLQPEPLLTPLLSDTTQRAYNFYVQDTWRMKPSLTLTYGLAYGWQTPAKEAQGLQTFVANHDTGDSIIDTQAFINAKAAAAQQGNIFNPTLSFIPILKSSRSNLYNIDWGNWAPRVSLAWNPSYANGLLGRMLGANKTVIRGGFGISYDRTTIVSNILQSFLGFGFADAFTTIKPQCNASGTPGAGCTAGSNPGQSSFRVGRDGTIPLPTINALTSPLVPGPFSDQLGLTTDATGYRIGRNYQVDFSVQRELPGNMLAEVGYIGRLGRNLPTSYDLDASPYFFKDSKSGQTFAQAFDNVGCVLRGEAGQTIRGFTCPATVQPQPFFENQLPGIGTAGLVAQDSTDFINGGVFGMFLNMDIDRQFALGLPSYNNLQVFAANLLQVGQAFSNYNALFATLHKRTSQGLQFSLNYTYSKSLDQQGLIQNDIPTILTPYNKSLTYGPSTFDHRNVFNASYEYDLPFGQSRRFSSGHGAVNKLISGWYTTGIFTASSGFPITASQGSDFGSFPINFNADDIQTASVSTGVHHNVAGSGGVGTNGNPTTGGSGINIFANPQQASNSFREPLLSVDGRVGQANPLYGFGFWNFDMALGKETHITEGVKVTFSADAFNLFNNVNFSNPSLDLTSPANFGVVTTTQTLTNRNQSARYMQLGLRVEF